MANYLDTDMRPERPITGAREMKTYEWLVYESADAFTIVGAGDSASTALRNAIEESNLMPSDYDLEDWDSVDWASDDAPRPENWEIATMQAYLQAVRDAQYHQLYVDGQLYRSALDQCADAAGIHSGPQTRRALAKLANEMLMSNETEADGIARVIAEFQRRREHAEA